MVASLITRAESFGARIRQAAISADRESAGQAYETRDAYYTLLERYYAAEVYERADANNAAIKAWYGLPRNIRPIALVPKRAVDWWPGQVYPGAWTADGLPATNGRPNRIPYDSDTPDELRLAVQQAFGWANGSRFLTRMVRMGAMLGNVFAEAEVHWSDDDAGHKVFPVLIHPRHVIELELNKRGDVKTYRLAIPQYDPATKRTYLWGKKVTVDSVTTYYDDDPRGYDGQPATVENPYGFVPAVWVPHQATGDVIGASAIDGIMPALDEYQGLLSSVDDYIHRFIRQPIAIRTKNPKGLLDLLANQSGGGSTHEMSDPNRGRQQLGFFPMPEDANPQQLMQNLGLNDADPHIKRIATEIELALPEIVLAEKLQEMDQVTRPGAMPLVNKVQQKLDEVVANYDLGTIRLGQMCAAIGGELARNGSWGLRSRLTIQQQTFLPFDLSSYGKGELDFGLIPRELVPKTALELASEASAIESLRTPTGLRHAGFSDTDIYGEGNEPETRPGILQERSLTAVAASQSGDLFATAFQRGLTTV